MKTFTPLTIVAIAILLWHHGVHADRLYHWIDTNGVSHISKEPPPEESMLREVMEYSVHADKPVKQDKVESREKTEKENRSASVEKLQKTNKRPVQKDDLTTACYMHAAMGDVYVYVFEFERPDRVVKTRLYRGNIPKGQKQLIKSSTGKILFSSQRSSDDRTYGDNRANCMAGNVISVP